MIADGQNFVVVFMDLLLGQIRRTDKLSLIQKLLARFPKGIILNVAHVEISFIEIRLVPCSSKRRKELLIQDTLISIHHVVFGQILV